MFESWIQLMHLFNSKNLLTMWFQQKSTGDADTDLLCRGAHSPFAFISGALYCIPFCSLYLLKSPVVYNGRFNKVTRYTWESQLPVMTPYNMKRFCVISSWSLQSAKRNPKQVQRQKSRGRWLSWICSKSSLIPFNPPQWSKCSICRHSVPKPVAEIPINRMLYVRY